MDRAGQLGRLRAWVGDHDVQLRRLCGEGTAVYGEWLWVRHGVPYDCLPDWLIVLDLWSTNSAFASVTERDERAAACGFTTPPTIGRHVTVESLSHAVRLIPAARWGQTQAEGVIFRRSDGQRCKVVRPDFIQRSNDSWRNQTIHNSLCGGRKT